VVNGKKRKLVFLISIITIMAVFASSLGCPLLLRFSPPFHIQVIIILAKIKNQFCSQQGLNTQPWNHKVKAQPIQQIMFCDNS